MPGLGITTDTDQSSVAIESIPAITWQNKVSSGHVGNLFTLTKSGASTGAVGNSNRGGTVYTTAPGITNAQLKFIADVDPLVAGSSLTNLEVYLTIYNITRGTQLSLPVHTPVVDDSDDTSITIWQLDSTTMDASLYDDVRSLTTGKDVLLLPNAFHTGITSLSRTAVNLEFTGSYSSEFELSFIIKSLATGQMLKSDTRRTGEGIFTGSVHQGDFAFPIRATHSGDPIFLDSYVDVTVDALSPSEDPIVMKNVPVRLVSNDTFDVTDKNGVKMDLTGTFEWIDKDGVEQSQTFPQSLTDTATMLITMKVAEETVSGSTTSRVLTASALVT